MRNFSAINFVQLRTKGAASLTIFLLMVPESKCQHLAAQCCRILRSVPIMLKVTTRPTQPLRNLHLMARWTLCQLLSCKRYNAGEPKQHLNSRGVRSKTSQLGRAVRRRGVKKSTEVQTVTGSLGGKTNIGESGPGDFIDSTRLGRIVSASPSLSLAKYGYPPTSAFFGTRTIQGLLRSIIFSDPCSVTAWYQ